MPLFHIGGSGWALCGHVARAAARSSCATWTRHDLLELIEGERITDAFVVPAVLMFLLATPGSGGDRPVSLRTHLLRRVPHRRGRARAGASTAFGCGFAQVYGMTETTGAITSLASRTTTPTGPGADLLRSAGKPLPRVELRIVDPETGEDVAAGEVGEVLDPLGPQHGRLLEEARRDGGQHRRRRLVAHGRRRLPDEEGYLFLHDRIKDMIVSGGENVYPAEVENVLLAHPVVADAAVIGVPRRALGRDGQGDRGAGARSGARRGRVVIAHCRGAWPTTSARRRSTSSTACPAIRRARSSNASCALPTGRARGAPSTDAVRDRPPIEMTNLAGQHN